MNSKELLKSYINSNKLSEAELLYVLKVNKFETELRFRKRIKNSELDSEENDEQILLLETFIKSLDQN